MANKVTQHQREAARTAFITKTADDYRAKAAAAGIREITGDAWAEMMRARMAAHAQKA